MMIVWIKCYNFATRYWELWQRYDVCISYCFFILFCLESTQWILFKSVWVCMNPNLYSFFVQILFFLGKSQHFPWLNHVKSTFLLVRSPFSQWNQHFSWLWGFPWMGVPSEWMVYNEQSYRNDLGVPGCLEPPPCCFTKNPSRSRRRRRDLPPRWHGQRTRAAAGGARAPEDPTAPGRRCISYHILLSWFS